MAQERMKRSAFLMGLVLVSACGRTATPAMSANHHDMSSLESNVPAAACEPSNERLTIEAVNNKFSKTCLAAPAGKEFTIDFTSQDPELHNISIYETIAEIDDPPFTGEPIKGPNTSVTYNVPAFAAGSYYFHCTFHRGMRGTFIAK